MQADRSTVAVIGGGPAGLAAAEALTGTADVHVFDAKPSFGRKFLLAGKSGLNLSHAEKSATFLTRYGPSRAKLEAALLDFGPDAIRAWAAGLGIETFIGTSGRIYPTSMKTSPLLRAWLDRLRSNGVSFHARHRWLGWSATGAAVFDTPNGTGAFEADAIVLALGGASWPHLGSDGGWVPLLSRHGIDVSPLQPANCGFDVAWSAHLRARHAGAPVKSVVLSACGRRVRGDFVTTNAGIEGSTVYALAADLRAEIAARGSARLEIDLTPDRSLARLTDALSRPRGKQTLANQLRKAAGLDRVKVALLREGAETDDIAGSQPPLPDDAGRLAARIKALPLTLIRARPIGEAISTAGGIALAELDDGYMLKKLPGVFAAGEMLDWEAPTGGYLLTACLATGRAAGIGARNWLRRRG